MPKYKEFELEDQVFIDLDLIEGAFGVLYGVDPQKLNEVDIEKFCNGMVWFTNNVKNDLKSILKKK